MANNGQIKYGIGFNIDKTGLNQLKAELQQITNMTVGDLVKLNPSVANNAVAELEKIKASARQLESALERSFNPNLGTLNVTKFNQELKKINVNKIYKDLSQAGAAGQKAFRDITTQVLTTNMHLKQTHSLLDSMAETMGNTIKWGIASSALNTFTGSVQKAYGYVKNLDTSLNNIRIVTEKSAEEMDKFAVKANKAAKSLGQSTTAYTDAALIYYQQGLAEEEVIARADTTLKAANVTGQAAADVSEQLTAVWNGFQVGAEETELYVDKLAAVAATTAADLEELSTGMSKVASAANAMGVDIDQLNGHLATVVSVTRQAPESVGTAFKTIYARLGDLAIGGEDEFGVSLGDVSGKLQQMGIDILDQQGNMRDMGTVMEEVAEKWDGWTEAQRQAAAVAMAGKRQYNNLIALFDNWNMYTDAVNTSKNAMGTLQTQQDIYMESTEAHLERMSASAEDLYDSLLDPKGINVVIDGLTLLIDLSSNFVDSIGGMKGVLLGLGSIGTRVFSKQIASGLAITIANIMGVRENLQKLNAEQEILNQFRGINITDEKTQELIGMKERILAISKSITEEERNTANEHIKQHKLLQDQEETLNQNLETAKELRIRLAGQTNANIETAKGREDLKQELITEQNDFKATNASNIKEAQSHFQNIVALEKSAEKTKDLSQAKKDYVKTMSYQAERAEELIALDQLDDKNKAKLQVALDKYNASLNKKGRISINDQKGMAAARELQLAYKNAIEDTDKQIEVAIKNLGRYDEAMKNTKESINGSKTSFEGWLKQLQLKDKINNVVNLAGAFGQAASSIQAVSQIGSIWNNEDLTGGEKLLQTITNLGFALPMLLSSMAQINEVMGFSTTITEALTAAKVAQLGVTQTAMAIEAAGVATKTANNAAILMESASQEIANKVKQETLRLKFKLITAEEYEIFINKMLAESNIEVGASGLTAATGMKAFLSSLGPIGWAFIAVGAISALAAAFDVFTTNSQEAGEKVQNTLKEIADSETNLDNLNNELETTAERIAELESKNSLSIVEEEELTRLKRENTLLEAQIKLEEEKLKLKRQQLILDYKEANRKGTYDNNYDNSPFEDTNARGEAIPDADKPRLVYKGLNLKTDPKFSKIFTLTTDDQEGFDTWVIDMQNLQQEVLNGTTGNYDSDEKRAAVASMIQTDIEKAKALWGEKRAEMQEKLLEGYTAGMEVLPSLIENNVGGIYDKEIKEIQDRAYDYFKKTGQLKQQVVDTFDDIIPSEKIFNELKKVDATDEQAIKRVLGTDGFDKLSLASEATGLSISQLVNEIQNGDFSFEQLQDSALKAASGIDTITDSLTLLQNASAKKAGLDGIFSKYEEGMYLDQDDVAEILSENPEYIQYLTEVNGKYVLNKEALKEWNRAVKEQDQAISNMMGNYDSMIGFNDPLSNIKNTGSKGKAADGYDAGLGKTSLTTENLHQFLDINTELNKSLTEGKITAKEYINELSKGLTDKGIKEALNEIKGNFDATTDSIEQTVAIIAGELSDVLIQSNKQFQKGEMSVKDYTEILHSGVDAQQELLAATYNLTIGQDGEVKNLDKLQGATKEAAERYNELEQAQKELGDNQVLIDSLTENAEFLWGYMDETGHIMDAAMDDSRWIQYVNSISNSVASFVKDNEERLNNMANALVEATDLGLDEAKRLLQQGGTELTNYLATNVNACEALTKASMTEVSGAITSTSGALGSVLSSLGKAIESFDFTITASPTLVPGEFDLDKFIDTKGKSGIRFPALGLKITGTGGTSVQNLAQSLSDAGTFFTSQSQSQGDTIDDYLPSGYKDSAVAANERPDLGKPKGSSGDPKKQDKIEEEIDRYHDVNVQIEKTSKELDRLAEAQDKLTDKEAIENLNKQLKVLKQQSKVYKEKLDIARQEQRELEASLGRQGVQFQNGMIMNYAAAIKAEQDRHNAVIEKYNNMSAAEQEKFQATLDESEKRFEKFMEDIERYDEVSHEVIEDLVDSLTEAAYQEIELNLEKLKIELEVKLDLTEAVKDWADFEREVIQDLEDTDFLGYAKSYSKEMADLMGSGTAELLTGRLNDTVAALQQIDAGTYTEGEFGAYTEDGRWVVNKSAALEQLKSDQSELMAFLTDLHDKQEEINQSYLDNIDNISDAYAKQSELYSFIDDQLNHSLNVIKLLKGDEAYEDMAKSYEQQKINNDQLLAAQIQQQNYYREMMEKETDPEAAEKWKELWISATQEVNATVEKSLEDIMNDHMNNVKMALKEIDDALGGTRTIKAKWDVAVDQDSRWMDGVNKAYNLATLENKFNESINSVDSIKGQRELNRLKEQELEKLREKDKLTQYDVDRANQLLDIEMKRIALEEAQKNKSKMRLRRDASGNYSYQFVADEEAQAQAQQELMDAQNSLYNMDKDHLREQQQELFAVWQEYQDLQTEYASLTLEERALREEEFATRFANLQQSMTDIAADCEWTQLNLAQSTFDSLGLMYEEDGIKFSDLNAEKQRQLTEELGPTFKNTLDIMIDAINNPENGYAAAWVNADKTIADSNKSVEASLEGIEKRLGLTPEEGLRNVSSNYYTEAIKKAGELALAQQANIDKYKLEQDAIGEVKNKVDLLAQSWDGVREAALAALQASQQYQIANGKKQEENKNQNQTNNQQNQKQESTSQKQEIKNTSGGDGVAKVGDVVTFDNGSYYADSYGGGSSGSAQRGKQVKITYTNAGAPFPYHIATLSGGPLGWLKLSQLKGYDTGGYTGAWGEEGKLAMLHQKELVLNAHDTENMLAMVKMVRELMKGSSVSESQSDSPENKLLGKIKLLTSLVQELRDSANIRTDNLIALADIINKINKAEELSLAERYEHDKALLAIQQEQLFASWEQIQRFTAGVDAAVKEINTDSIAKFNQTAETLKAMTAKQDRYNDLLQDIKIYADFPDATNADEIKAAFNNLALTASQRAYSTKK